MLNHQKLNLVNILFPKKIEIQKQVASVYTF